MLALATATLRCVCLARRIVAVAEVYEFEDFAMELRGAFLMRKAH
jgi:hypothetical protein